MMWPGHLSTGISLRCLFILTSEQPHYCQTQGLKEHKIGCNVIFRSFVTCLFVLSLSDSPVQCFPGSIKQKLTSIMKVESLISSQDSKSQGINKRALYHGTNLRSEMLPPAARDSIQSLPISLVVDIQICLQSPSFYPLGFMRGFAP